MFLLGFIVLKLQACRLSATLPTLSSLSIVNCRPVPALPPDMHQRFPLRPLPPVLPSYCESSFRAGDGPCCASLCGTKHEMCGDGIGLCGGVSTAKYLYLFMECDGGGVATPLSHFQTSTSRAYGCVGCDVMNSNTLMRAGGRPTAALTIN
jgi:hypothetical protein